MGLGTLKEAVCGVLGGMVTQGTFWGVFDFHVEEFVVCDAAVP